MKKLLIALTAGLLAVTAQAQQNRVHHGGGHWRKGVQIREPQQGNNP
jgi:hypothetical protein